MTFHSILFEDAADATGPADPVQPGFFTDLNLDQIVESVTSPSAEYHLEPFFYTPLSSLRAIEYRHQVFRDLEDRELLGFVDAFSRKMRTMHSRLAQAEKLRHKYQKERWFLDATDSYCDAVCCLVHDLASARLGSSGLLAFRERLTHYAHSSAFTGLVEEAKRVRTGLSRVRYCLRILANRVDVTRYESESDYSADITATFEKFRRGPAKDYRTKYNEWADMNHVEAGVLDRVALLHPDAFSALDHYCARHQNYLDKTVANFAREVQFYVAYLRFRDRFTPAGLMFCYPLVSESKEISARETFDLALANKRVPEKTPVVCNDFHLTGTERIFVVSGPNQGGKTTFARTFGQLHYLAGLGCPVPGRQAKLFLHDRLFTHFEREEDLRDLSGKLQSDLVRIHEILQGATADSIIIMNEIFTSTTLSDAISLGTKVIERIVALDLLCVCVTFVDELATLGDTVVSMVSTVLPDNPVERTFKVVRRPADGLSYAMAIAAKHGLTYDRLKERLAS